MRKKVQILLLTITMILLCGCGKEEVIKVSSSGKITTTIYGYATPKEASKKGSIKTVKINGKKYYKFKAKYSPNGGEVPMGSTTADIKKGFYYVSTYTPDGDAEVTSGASHLDKRYHKAVLNKTTFLDIAEGPSQDYEFDIIKITFPKKIKYTNGKLSKDKKTVTFDYNDFKKGDTLYAVTTKKAALNANVGSIKLTGIDTFGYLRKAKTLKVKTDDKIKYIKVNGKKQKSTKIKIKKEGKYKIEIKTNKATVSYDVCYDKTKPKVKIKQIENDEYGNKQYKVTFSDENSGVKKAEICSQLIESGHIFNEAGYLDATVDVIDNAGNKISVPIGIQIPD